ncbi:rab3 GTPase-activating protein non-catalytic subunit isoform X2 [Octopus sinensis]|uniref:Rab3 GTPase-activating protein non-catalytic subunit isoform X2 n=1 Tax=Octopus sinensis TaxID=2607531 RepID=A0A6P7SXR0_9MOLL|nr:rab3 GTPase-activating protein non-catalytic subunit isoform X2 [Octopus sinensis]
MSCQLIVLSQFQDISSIKRYLFPFLKDCTPDPSGTEDAWSSSWDWTVESQNQDEEEENHNRRKEHETWLQDSIISLSPANDLLAIANEDRIVLLAQKYDPQGSEESLESKLSPVWQGSLRQEEGEQITAVLCLPLASQKKSMQGAPDWTCVIVGFSSGYIRMYTENGTLLLSQLLHEEPVQKLKCKSYEAPRYLGMAEQHEELMILYKKAFLTIDGFSLFQSLRACRNQVARAAASHSESFLQAPPLAYKKWAFQDQDQIFDQCSRGICSPSAFSQMTIASNVKGFYSAVRLSPPATSLYITSGSFPCVGFFYAEEGSMQPILSDVAYAVAHKLKSAFVSAASGLLGFGSENKEKRRPKIEPATTLPLRFGLPDKRRIGESIVLSPNNKYAATTDSYGRVILLDVQRGIGIRMWKGYRDAQVGWVQVKEEKSQCTNPQKMQRLAQFFVIYAPRRGILEVWTAVYGPRVAAFNVCKRCRLICQGYGMMGLNNVTSRDTKTKTFQIALVDTNGFIKTIDVPFHLALSDKSSKRARDLHLLKKLKTLLKECNEESESLKSTVKETLLDMKISSIAQQGVERVLNTKYLSTVTMQNIIRGCINQMSGKAEEALDIDSRLFLLFCQSQNQLLRTYSMLDKAKSTCYEPKPISNVEQHLMNILSATKSEIEHVLRQLIAYDAPNNFNTSAVQCTVTFEEQPMSVTNFLSCFEYPLHRQESQTDSSQSSPSPSTLSVSSSGGNLPIVSKIRKIPEDKKNALCDLFYDGCLSNKVSAEDLSRILQDCAIPPDHLMDLLQHYWLSSDNRNIETQVYNLYHVILTLTRMSDTSDVMTSVDSISPWWEKIREACTQSTNSRAAYILALTARGVAMDMMTSKTKAKDPDADTADTSQSDKADNGISEWEDVSVDYEKWNVLIRQLEDTLALNSLLKMKIPPPSMSTISSAASEPLLVSVSHLLDGGRGSIPEIVAKFISRANFSHEVLNRPRGLVLSETVEMAEEPLENIHVRFEEQFLGQLDTLQERFPHSLDSDVLLANCSWEYIVLWNKDLEQYHYLQTSLNYLNTIQNAVLRQGLGTMLWNMFAVKRLSAAANLMEKVGKHPKERLCRKEIGISDTILIHFVGLVSHLLAILMKANCEADEVPVFNIEPLWQTIRGPASLVELAVDQKATNYGLLLHHYLLCQFMYAILKFGLKSIKVLSLFDCKGQNSFFKDLHTHPALPTKLKDANILAERNKFYKKVISQSVEDFSKKDKQSQDSLSASMTASVPESTQMTFVPWNESHAEWPSLIIEIARVFEEDVDQLRIYHVRELYLRGLDKTAEEVLLTMNLDPELGASLLEVLGQRIVYYIEKQNPSKSLDIYASMTTSLSQWLKKQDTTSLYTPDCSVPAICQLLNQVVKCLEEGSDYYNRAIALVELVSTLKTS